MNALFKAVHRIEDISLVVMLTAMIGLASLQILLRNVFDSGLVWADPMLRIMVLWLSMIGASIASRHNNHIRIDLFSRYCSNRTNLWIQAVVNLFTAVVCLLIAWHGTRWIHWEYTDHMPGIAGIPAWTLEVIIPVSFALIGLRFCLMSIRIGFYFYRRAVLHGEFRQLHPGVRS